MLIGDAALVRVNSNQRKAMIQMDLIHPLYRYADAVVTANKSDFAGFG